MPTTYRDPATTYRASSPYRGIPNPLPELDLDRDTDISIYLVDKYGKNFGELPAATVDSVQWTLNESGSAKITFNNADPTLKRAFLLVRDVQIVWNDVIDSVTGLPVIWWGTLVGESGQPGQKAFTLEEPISWLKVRPIEAASIDYTVATDQFDIAWNLINTAQTGTNYDLNLRASYAPSGVQRLRYYDRSRHQYFYDLLMEFSSLKLRNGFDWEMVYDRGAGHRTWTPYYPSKGIYRPECKLEWDRNMLDYKYQRDGFGTASKAFATGASENGVKFEQSYEDVPTSANFGAMVKVVADSGQKDVGWLADLAQKTVEARMSPPTTLTVTVKDIPASPDNEGIAVPIFGRLHTGDSTDVEIDDDANQVSGRFRVKSIKWKPNREYDVEFVNPLDLVTV